MPAKGLNPSSIKFLVVHTAATKPSMDIGVPEISRWHRARGFLKIGYHFVIRRDGTVEKGRDITEVGAHVQNFNSQSLGVCLVGGLNEKTSKAENNYTPQQWESLEKLLKELHQQFPQATVQGHRDFPNVAKDCPCFDVKPWWASVINK